MSERCITANSDDIDGKRLVRLTMYYFVYLEGIENYNTYKRANLCPTQQQNNLPEALETGRGMLIVSQSDRGYKTEN